MPLALAFTRRYITLTLAVVVAALTLPFAAADPAALVVLLVALLLVAVGVHDLLQRRHSILRNYPIARPPALPAGVHPAGDPPVLHRERQRRRARSPRQQRSLVYQRAKGAARQAAVRHAARRVRRRLRVDQPLDRAAAGRRRTTSASRSAAGLRAALLRQRLQHLGDELRRAVSANAIRALNDGAKRGGFAHDTGEGSIQPLSPRARRRPDLGDRLGLLRLPQRRRHASTPSASPRRRATRR